MRTARGVSQVYGTTMWVVAVALGLAACSKPPAADNKPAVADDARAPAATQGKQGDDTMMFIEVEGTRDELLGLRQLDGIETTGFHPLDGGRYRTSAYVTRRAVLDELAALGLTVRITVDEDEVVRRIEADKELMKDAWPDAGPTPPHADDDSDPDPP